MQAVQLEGETCHFCYECEVYYTGPVERKSVLADDYAQGTLMDEVDTYEVYYCSDPGGSCELEDDQFEEYSEAWMCGNCEGIHPSAAGAIACCQD